MQFFANCTCRECCCKLVVSSSEVRVGEDGYESESERGRRLVGRYDCDFGLHLLERSFVVVDDV